MTFKANFVRTKNKALPSARFDEQKNIFYNLVSSGRALKGQPVTFTLQSRQEAVGFVNAVTEFMLSKKGIKTTS